MFLSRFRSPEIDLQKEGRTSPKGRTSPAVQVAEVDESRRKFLREVELKVVKFADKLEASGGPKSGRTLQEELSRFRAQLLEVVYITCVSLFQSCLFTS